MDTPSELVATAVGRHAPILPQVEQLYVDAFPAAERVPFKRLVQSPLNGYTDKLWVFTRNDEFCGFMTTITRADLTLVGYFAMMPALRGQGNGSAALQLMRGMMPQQRIALEIEVLDPQAANYSERVRRRDFYIRNGYRMTSIQYWTYGVPFVVMVNGADISAEEYHQFYDPLVKS
ncbi:hypothetical protein FC50_GL000791 [Lacticaseibacillus pantheris DSM 15945 = JCM 12539 = NBRC 106106]|uniref:N-acetyltransferase domain-containing protein n=1 Tax=Lacticaseibacillus pantheris DSM 15945 = JCM 12539 = NBRC 106106 TaxID=1423783 RepID=A0A0R1U0S4_9LACO|nr:GNAT family N-acetyltransferase [Lacticaseibacillus pantheris]KRL86542.1 hypothetical protein FC50_GL000791 [Lacticaseibacillus pantheris DSM 15945 = JCM 12539 = NBRC 106106]